MDVARGEQVEKELDAMIGRRSRQKDPEEEHDLWRESAERYNARRSDEIRAERVEYHRGQAVRLRTVLETLIDHHETQAVKLLGGCPTKGAT